MGLLKGTLCGLFRDQGVFICVTFDVEKLLLIGGDNGSLSEGGLSLVIKHRLLESRILLQSGQGLIVEALHPHSIAEEWVLRVS